MRKYRHRFWVCIIFGTQHFDRSTLRRLKLFNANFLDIFNKIFEHISRYKSIFFCTTKVDLQMSFTTLTLMYYTCIIHYTLYIIQCIIYYTLYNNILYNVLCIYYTLYNNVLENIL